MDDLGLIAALTAELERSGIDLRALTIGWARVAPVIAIVPAFGLRALPTPIRSFMALCLAACIAPAVQEQVIQDPWAYGLLISVARGLPIAIAAAVPLWAATMAGGAIDAVRHSSDSIMMPTVEGRPTLFGVLMALLASTLFLTTGGPSKVALALTLPLPFENNLMIARVAADLTAGIHIALAVAAPVLAASVVVEVSSALMARAASPAQVHALVAPLRSFAILTIAALTLDRMVRIIAMVIQRPFP